MGDLTALAPMLTPSSEPSPIAKLNGTPKRIPQNGEEKRGEGVPQHLKLEKVSLTKSIP